ncbi:MAG: tetratricopeptide repeat protein [Firmicutes bacterium]|nr:tetratricopeptide repeat protein [Bacillota bacterium]
MLKKEDYLEPDCPFDTSMWEKNEAAGMIPMDRVMEKEDELLSRSDYAGAERILRYWISEAESLGDKRGVFLVENELMGLYRKLGNEEKARASMDVALALIPELGYGDAVSGATCYINAGTVLKAFGDPQGAMELFEKARPIYEEKVKSSDWRLGGMYNNLGLVYFDLDRYDEALEVYDKALSVVRDIPGQQPEAAITMLNIADVYVFKYGFAEGESRIRGAIEQAWVYLNVPGQEQSGNYAFVCEKCAPVFEYYGYTEYADECRVRAKRIYERA